MQKELQGQLYENYLLNLPVIGFFDNYPIKRQTTFNQSMVLEGTSDYTWAYMSVPDPNDFKDLLEQFNFNTPYLANVEEWMVPHLTRHHRIDWKLFTNRYYLPDDVEVEASDKQVASLDQSLVGYIYQNSPYKDFTSVSYISEMLERDVSAGVWINDQLAGWGLSHDDGSLGFLNVLSEHRGQGLGEAIFRTLIRAKRARKKPVFVNVEPQNQQSISLIEKLGLQFDRPVSWMKLSL